MLGAFLGVSNGENFSLGSQILYGRELSTCGGVIAFDGDPVWHYGGVWILVVVGATFKGAWADEYRNVWPQGASSLLKGMIDPCNQSHKIQALQLPLVPDNSISFGYLSSPGSQGTE